MLRIPALALTLVTLTFGLGTASASARTNALPDRSYDVIVTLLEAEATFAEARMPTKPQLDALQAACNAVPQDDALLASQRATCRGSVALMRLVIATPCETDRGCLRVLDRTATSAKALATLMSRDSRIIDTSVPAGPCRKLLRSPAADVRAMREVGRRYNDLARAIRTKNEKLYRSALRRLAKLTDRDTPDRAEQIEAFKAAC